MTAELLMLPSQVLRQYINNFLIKFIAKIILPDSISLCPNIFLAEKIDHNVVSNLQSTLPPLLHIEGGQEDVVLGSRILGAEEDQSDSSNIRLNFSRLCNHIFRNHV